MFSSATVDAQVSWDQDPLLGNATHGARTFDAQRSDQILQSAAIDPAWVPAREFATTLADITPEQIDVIANPSSTKSALKMIQSDSVVGLADALTDETEALVCPWLDQKIRAESITDSQVLEAHYKHCSSAEFPPFKGVAESKLKRTTRLRRAERMFYNVRFYNAAAELDRLAKTSDDLDCRVQFLRGRVLYRIRKRRTESEPSYKNAIKLCDDKADVKKYSLRKKALYAVGKRRFDVGDPKNAKEPFETLIKDYPKSSHLDDALLYLARIARKLGDSKSESKWVKRAATEARDGDMLFEIVWEYVESHYRKRDYVKFLKQIELLKLPEQDDQYFSQGRLEYFSALSHIALKNKPAAFKLWESSWEKYPFSFYGYLSALRLKENKQIVPKIDRNTDSPSWLSDKSWRRSPAAWALRKKHFEFASWTSERMAQTEQDDRWRAAYVAHHTGNFPRSHNIVRRKIPDRPWMQPEQGRLTRLELAWPQPFADVVKRSVEAEQKQHKKATLHPAFPSAIMREESSFVEDIESYAGALGLMQLMPRTALGHDNDIEGDAVPERLKTAEVNVRVAADHLFWLSKRLDGHPALMAAAYNAGLGAVSKWLKRQPNDDIAMFIEDVPYLQARDYTKRVVGSYAAYQYMMGETELDPKLARPGKP